jgi:molybdopterin synthase catalytic subunit
MIEIKQDKSWILIGENIPGITKAWEFVQDPACGATQLFTGTTRNHHDGKEVTDLYYDCYEEMAGKECQKLLDELFSRNPVSRIALFHKTGHAPVGETSLVIAISAAHSKPAIESVSELIHKLKKHVPVWKRETFRDGSSMWKEDQMIKNR